MEQSIPQAGLDSLGPGVSQLILPEPVTSASDTAPLRSFSNEFYVRKRRQSRFALVFFVHLVVGLGVVAFILCHDDVPGLWKTSRRSSQGDILSSEDISRESDSESLPRKAKAGIDFQEERGGTTANRALGEDWETASQHSDGSEYGWLGDIFIRETSDNSVLASPTPLPDASLFRFPEHIASPEGQPTKTKSPAGRGPPGPLSPVFRFPQPSASPEGQPTTAKSPAGRGPPGPRSPVFRFPQPSASPEGQPTTAKSPAGRGRSVPRSPVFRFPQPSASPEGQPTAKSPAGRGPPGPLSPVFRFPQPSASPEGQPTTAKSPAGRGRSVPRSPVFRFPQPSASPEGQPTTAKSPAGRGPPGPLSPVFRFPQPSASPEGQPTAAKPAVRPGSRDELAVWLSSGLSKDAIDIEKRRRWWAVENTIRREAIQREGVLAWSDDEEFESRGRFTWSDDDVFFD